jgi:hypothetical protein
MINIEKKIPVLNVLILFGINKNALSDLDGCPDL